MATKKNKAPVTDETNVSKSAASGDDNVRHTDANPPVHDASVLAPTQAEVKDELAKHSDIERKTGVAPEELDTRPVVDTNPGNGKSFAERTTELQPWADFQREAAAADERKADELNK